MSKRFRHHAHPGTAAKALKRAEKKLQDIRRDGKGELSRKDRKRLVRAGMLSKT